MASYRKPLTRRPQNADTAPEADSEARIRNVQITWAGDAIANIMRSKRSFPSALSEVLVSDNPALVEFLGIEGNLSDVRAYAEEAAKEPPRFEPIPEPRRLY